MVHDHTSSEGYREHFAYITECSLWDFSEELSHLMEERKVTKAWLSSKTKIRPAKLEKILAGDHDMTVTDLGKIASALKVKVKIGFAK
jgi:predicted transcriptional regulator